jgi:hypothetical protein
MKLGIGFRISEARLPTRAFLLPWCASECIMADKSKNTWYVSFELPRGKRPRTRLTEAFPNEHEAKQFARATLVDTVNVSAGTLNPHLPKRTVAATEMLEWLQEPD